MSKMIMCKKCGELKELCAKEMCRSCYGKEHYKENKEHYKEYREKNKEKIREYGRNWHYKHGSLPMKENKSCSNYLGVHVAEQVLSKVFKNVKQMSPNNPGYDFKCNRDKKVDVKSSVLCYHNRSLGCWSFNIKKNTIANYFLCIAFDNRNDLNPQHIWLIPGEEVNHLTNTSISKSTLSKWREYKLDINKVVDCCNSMKR